MEMHPVVGNADATKVPCPDSVLKGTHRDLYDNDKFPVIQTPYTHYQGTALPITPFTYHLTRDQIKQFHADGFIVIRAEDLWTKDELELLVNSTAEVDQWPDQAGKWMKYYEKQLGPQGEKLLCRIENFVDYHAGMKSLLCGEKLVSLSSQLFGEPAVLYKEKINYKLPGGDGFAPHQDVAAGWWMYGQTFHISTLIAVDHAHVQNGCLEVVRGKHNQGMLSEPWREVDPQHVATSKWEYVETKPGDVVFFDSYVPHRSSINQTTKPRRVLYATYAKQSEGDYRAQYYADKRLSFPPDIERTNGLKYEYKI